MSFGSRSLPPPTAEQKRRWELIRKSGCLCCRMMNLGFRWPEIHHIKSGNLRMGHDFTIGLCAWHHQGHKVVPSARGDEVGVNVGPPLTLKRDFIREFGDEMYLLGEQNKEIGWTKEPVRERKKKSRCTASDKQVKRPQGGFAR